MWNTKSFLQQHRGNYLLSSVSIDFFRHLSFFSLIFINQTKMQLWVSFYFGIFLSLPSLLFPSPNHHWHLLFLGKVYVQRILKIITEACWLLLATISWVAAWDERYQLADITVCAANFAEVMAQGILRDWIISSAR